MLKVITAMAIAQTDGVVKIHFEDDIQSVSLSWLYGCVSRGNEYPIRVSTGAPHGAERFISAMALGLTVLQKGTPMLQS